MHGRTGRRLRALALAVLLVAVAVPAAAADDDEGSRAEVRVSTTCPGGGRAELRVRARDDEELRIDLALRGPRRASWSVVILHERRLVYSGRLRADRAGRLAVRRTVRDWFGEDAVVVRASGPAGGACRLSGRVANDD
jgi:hypothetical protein